MITTTHVTLSTGAEMPRLGLGTYRITGEGAPQTIATAIAAGYRLIDTAASYDNENEIGEGIRLSSVSSDQLFVTTKIRKRTEGEDAAVEGVNAALARLGLDRLDLVLIHGPNESRETAIDTWRGLIRVRELGLARNVGVSNFSPGQLEQLHTATGEWPTVNQVQLSPALQRRADVDFHRQRGIASMAWSPLGVEHGVLEHPVVKEIANRLSLSPAAVALSWGMQRGHVVIPRSNSTEHLHENLRAAEVTLGASEIAQLEALDTAQQSDWEASSRAAW